MNDIAYTYEVLRVDERARVMELVYQSEGRQPVHIGARMPYVGETLDAVARMYAPVAWWREQEAQVLPIQAGAAGSVAPVPLDMSLPAVKERKLAELADARWRYETGGIMVGGVPVKTDRESQATISGAYSSLKDGLLTAIDFKGANNQWALITLAEITPIAQAVAVHVQAAFSLERQLCDQVMAATTVAQVEAVVWPV